MVMAEWMESFLAGMDGRSYRAMVMGDSLASRAMNRISATFLETECDEMFIWDADVIATREQVDFLFSHDLPIVFGFYPIKEPGLKLCASSLTGEFPVTDEPLVEMRRIGRGFVRIHREVLERMKRENGGKAAPYFNHGRPEWDFWSPGVYQPPLAVLSDEYLCENWAFCEHARELGYKIQGDQRISLLHRGAVNFPLPGTFEVRKRSEWERIPGWFNYEKLYKRLADSFEDGAKFVEVGCWLGKSLGAMASYCAGKDVSLYAVDTFKGSPGTVDEHLHSPLVEKEGGTVRHLFEANMQTCGLNGNLHILETESTDAATAFKDGELDAVFIDASHDRASVERDIDAWLPRVRSGGVLSGHDFDRAEVREAVAAKLGTQSVDEFGTCWVYQKP